MKILAIGNSFSKDATRYLQTIAESAGSPLFVRNCYIGGCSLKRHVENTQTDEQAYEYECDAQMLEMISLKEALVKEDWDYVTVQQVSSYSGMYETYIPYLPQLLSFIRELAPNAKIVFHRTWNYEITSTHKHFPNYNCDRDTMYNAIIETTEKAAAEFDLPIIKSGDAIYKAQQFPEFDVRKNGISLMRDGYHLSLTYGRYLAALVWLKFFTGITPDKVSFVPEDTDPKLIQLIQSVV